MKKTIALALALLLALTLFGCWKQPEPSPAPAPESTPDPNRGETVTTATPAPTPEETPMRTPEPAETFWPGPEPSDEPAEAPPATAAPQPTETPQPAETPPPTASPSPSPEPGQEPVVVNPAVLASGSFRSDTGTPLNLVADWRAVSVSDNAARITVTLSLESYSLDIGERRGNLLTFNGQEYYFMTDPIELTGGDFMKTQIYVWSQEIPLSQLSFELSVKWNLMGSYSKKEMDSIELSGSFDYAP